MHYASSGYGDSRRKIYDNKSIRLVRSQLCILNKSTRSRNDITDITADHYGDVYFLQWVKSYYKELYIKIIQMHQCKFSTPPINFNFMVFSQR